MEQEQEGPAPLDVIIVTDLGKDNSVREIGGQAVWSVSSAKPGNGVELLRDGNTDTYWQSDGLQPHMVNIQFQKKVEVVKLCIYLDYKHDESYTPQKVSVRAGSSFHDLKELKVLDLEEPAGWVVVPLTPKPDVPLRAYLIQVAVIGNHQNGRDTHIRQVLVFGQRHNQLSYLLGPVLELQTPEALQYSTVR